MHDGAQSVELVYDAQAFLAAPHGRCLASEHAVAWYRDDACSALVMWGHPTDDDLRCMMAFKQARCQPEALPHRTLIDLHRVEHVERTHFERLLAHNQRLNAGLARSGTVRCAVVRPAGFVGAAIEGFLTIEGAPPTTAPFTTQAAAIDWLGLPGGAQFQADLQTLERRARGTPRAVEELRRAVAAGEVSGSLPAAARRLGVSARTLQRQLHAAGTSYRDEVNAVRVRRTQELLRTTDLKLLGIALTLGVKKPQQLSALFRRMTGESPAAFRHRLRSTDARPIPDADFRVQDAAPTRD